MAMIVLYRLVGVCALAFLPLNKENIFLLSSMKDKANR